MKPQEMLENLTKQAEELRQDILQTEQSFIQKKEQFIRLQGAIEVLNLLESNNNEETNTKTVVPTEVVAPE
jgi:vacuolar-type H+-ATPase subunit H